MSLRAGVEVGPADVAGDRGLLGGVRGVVAAVEGEVAQRGELGLDAVEPRAVERHVGQFDVVRRRPVADPGVGGGGAMQNTAVTLRVVSWIGDQHDIRTGVLDVS